MHVEYITDPLLCTTVTPKWFTELTRAMEETRADAAALAGLPVLMMQGTADEIVDLEATKAFPAPGREYVEFPGFYHEIFNEDDRRQALLVLDAWLEKRL
ncbi:MAG: serine aminopeptidase domain-containing protein [Patescibacteria group bacterium]